ncbi:hypothetical protein LguiA_026514 [Lonicera macranthoides]
MMVTMVLCLRSVARTDCGHPILKPWRKSNWTLKKSKKQALASDSTTKGHTGTTITSRNHRRFEDQNAK